MQGIVNINFGFLNDNRLSVIVDDSKRAVILNVRHSLAYKEKVLGREISSHQRFCRFVA